MALILAVFILFKSLIDKLIVNKNTLFMVYITTLFMEFALPAYEFGQREHFLLILMLPYLMSCAATMQKIRISQYQHWMIAVMASLAFALKPFFLSILLVNELNICLTLRSIKTLYRLELLIITGLSVIYLMLLYIFYYDYIMIILPIVSDYYFIGMRKSLLNVITNLDVLYSLFSVVLYLYFKPNHYIELQSVFFVTLLALIISFLVPGTFFLYQTMPAVAIASLLNTLNITAFIQSYSAHVSTTVEKSRYHILTFSLFIIVYAVPVLNSIFLYQANRSTVTHPSTKAFLRFIAKQSSNFSYVFLSAESDALLADLYPKKHGNYVGSFSSFWWQRGLSMMKAKTTSTRLLKEINDDAKLLVDVIANDIIYKKPNYVFVDTVNTQGLDYVTYFSRYAAFRRAWRKYECKGAVGRFLIYTRV